MKICESFINYNMYETVKLIFVAAKIDLLLRKNWCALAMKQEQWLEHPTQELESSSTWWTSISFDNFNTLVANPIKVIEKALFKLSD